MMRVLLVEDNRELSAWLAKSLRHSKYTVDCVYDGEDANHALEMEEYALVILDLALPKSHGLEVLRRLRARGSDVPVVILTASDTIDARVRGLNTGADDYLAKPFDVNELEARMRACLRRSGASKSVIRCGSLVYDRNSRQFTVDDHLLELTAREHALLETLALRSGTTVRKTALTAAVFGFDDDANPSAIEVYVHRVRRKLAGSGCGIVTLRGLGYVLKEGSDG
jgi:two-component system response regulator TctD